MEDEWERIKRELENSKYKWRTIEGVVSSTGLSTTTVVNSFSAHSNDVIKSTIPSTDGKDLYTTRDHYRQKSSTWSRIVSGIKNKIED